MPTYLLTSSSSWCIARSNGAAPCAMSASETRGITPLVVPQRVCLGDDHRPLAAAPRQVRAPQREQRHVHRRRLGPAQRVQPRSRCTVDLDGGELGAVGALHGRAGRVERHAHARRHACKVLGPPGELCADALLAAALRLPQRVVGVLQLQRRHGLVR
eukprot:scaffold87105_cov80-Phaeocystis_antarctica.AAC.2